MKQAQSSTLDCKQRFISLDSCYVLAVPTEFDYRKFHLLLNRETSRAQNKGKTILWNKGINSNNIKKIWRKTDGRKLKIFIVLSEHISAELRVMQWRRRE